jgi:cob(I)alamin adenosyltransferase
MANRLTQIVTRTGDDGTTGLGDGTRVAKSHLRIQAMGDVDELNSHLGVLMTEALPADVRSLLVVIQHELFNLGGELCMPGHALLSAGALLHLDDTLALHNAVLPRLAEFILPGGTRSAAYAHVCRTIARRAERTVIALKNAEELEPATAQLPKATPEAPTASIAPKIPSLRPEIQHYLNRLSDLLFVLARTLNRANLDGLGGDDVYWKSERLKQMQTAEANAV